MLNVCHHFRRHILLAAIGVLAALAAIAPAGAGEPSTVMIVFDGSGSMWGRLDGERLNKLAMAREAVKAGLARMTPGTRVGLASFGHRRGGDCSDTEVVLKPEPLDAERIMAPLEKLNPRGRGPMSKALREIAPDLGPQSAPASVILLHDGLDNCQQNPCETVGELRQAHPGVRIFVITLGLPAEEARTMACLTDPTGGKHYHVNTADEAAAAVVNAVQLANAVAAPSPMQPAPGGPPGGTARPLAKPALVFKGRPGLQLSARLVAGGPRVTFPLTWRVRPADGKGPPLWEGTGAAPLLQLRSGRYEIEASAGLVSRKVVAEAVQGQPKAAEIVLDAGTLVLADSQPSLALLRDGVISLAAIAAKGVGEPRLLREIPAELALPAGNYLLAVTLGALRIERPVGITSGARVSIANALNLGAVELSTVAIKGGPHIDDVVYAIYEDDPDAPQGRREVARSAAPDPSFKLPGGTYFVIARRGAAETRDRITIRPGVVEKRQLQLEAGRVAVAVTIPGGLLEGRGPITHRLERIGGATKEVLRASGPSAVIDATAGRYRLDTRVGLGNVHALREISLKPGELLRIGVEHAAGEVRLRLREGSAKSPLADVSWDIRDRNGKTVWGGVGTQARALLLAGRYSVIAEARHVRVERSIDVKAGEARDVELTVN